MLSLDPETANMSPGLLGINSPSNQNGSYDHHGVQTAPPKVAN